MQRFFLILFSVILFAAPVQATSPCVPLTAEQFSALKSASDVIAHVRITDYAVDQSNPHSLKSWTRADVLRVYKGELGDTVVIAGWASYFQPLYTYDKNSEAVLLLKTDGNVQRLVDSSWSSCVPSVIGIPDHLNAEDKDVFIRARLVME